MNQDPQSPDSGTPSDDDFEPMSPAEFSELCRTNPEEAEARLAGIVEVVRNSMGGDFGDMTEQMRVLGERILAKRAVFIKLKAAQQKYQVLQQKLDALPHSSCMADGITECQRLVEELVDDTLELPEPHRTNLLESFVPLRDDIRTLKVLED